MKRMKRKMASFLIFVMIMAMCMPAIAAEPEKGTITVRNATVGVEYNLYKIFDLTYATPSAAPIPVAYTYTKAGESDNLYTALQTNAGGVESPFKLNPGAVDGKFDVYLKSGKSASDVSKFFNELIRKKDKDGNDITPIITPIKAVKAESSVLEFTGLDFGYYIVDSALKTPSTLTIDSTIPNVEVIDKNQGPSWDNATPSTPDPFDPENPPKDPEPYEPGHTGNGKVIIEENGKKVFKTENSANYGDTLKFSISVNATSYALPTDTSTEPELVTYYYIKDKLGAAFNPATNIEVEVIKPGEKSGAGTKLEEGTTYSITRKDAENFFEITVPFGEKYGANAKIEVTYTSTLKSTDAVNIGSIGNENVTNFTYQTDSKFDPDNPTYDPKKPGDPENPNYPQPDDGKKKPYDDQKEKKTVTYVYALAIQKTDENGKALSGAVFSLTTGAEKTQVWATKMADGIYAYCKSETTGAVKEFEVSKDGLLVIKGVKGASSEDKDKGIKYFFTEVKAPNGYNRLNTETEVSAYKVGSRETTIIVTYYYDKDGKLVNTEEKADPTKTKVYEYEKPVFGVGIMNQKGTELPETGGAGTTLLIVLGSILFMGTAVVLVSKKRLYNESR